MCKGRCFFIKRIISNDNNRRNLTELNDRSSPIGDFFFSRFSTKHDSVDKLRRLSRAYSICSEDMDIMDRVSDKMLIYMNSLYYILLPLYCSFIISFLL